MSHTDGKAGCYSEGSGRPGPKTHKALVGVVTLAGALTLTDEYREVLKLDPGGNHRDVTIGATCNKAGRYFRIINAADAPENLVVKNTDGDTIATINQNEQGEFYYAEELESANDTDNWILICITAIALS